jgi:hypothetical protein
LKHNTNHKQELKPILGKNTPFAGVKKNFKKPQTRGLETQRKPSEGVKTNIIKLDTHEALHQWQFII